MLLYLPVPGRPFKSWRVCLFTWLPTGIISWWQAIFDLCIVAWLAIQDMGGLDTRRFWGNQFLSERICFQSMLCDKGKQIWGWKNLVIAHIMWDDLACATLCWLSFPPVLWPVFMPIININMFIYHRPLFCVLQCVQLFLQNQNTYK